MRRQASENSRAEPFGTIVLKAPRLSAEEGRSPVWLQRYLDSESGLGLAVVGFERNGLGRETRLRHPAVEALQGASTASIRRYDLQARQGPDDLLASTGQLTSF